MRFPARLGFVLSLAALTPVLGAPAQAPKDLANEVQASHLSRVVDRLTSFGTRHTLSDPLAKNRGIGAVRDFLADEFHALTKISGSHLVAFEDRFTAEPGPQLPKGAELSNLGVLLPGIDPDRGNQALVVVAHYDSRASDPLDGRSDAPGAVDNASGVALVLEMAQVMATQTPAIGIYFVATAAGEQGGLGSARLAERLKAQGTDIIGMVAADCVGNSLASDGTRSTGTMRLFSTDDVPLQETEGQRRVRELLGTANDGPSRELARYLKRAGEAVVDSFTCKVMLRKDRIGQRGEQAPFAQEGCPSVEATEFTDCYERLRQNVRREGTRAYGDTGSFFDSGYCARITKMMVAGFRELSNAPQAPQNVGLGGGGTDSAKLWWTLPDDPRITAVVVYRRPADSVQWQSTAVFPKGESAKLPGVGPDNDVFAVATMDAQGNQSLPVSPRSIDF